MIDVNLLKQFGMAGATDNEIAEHFNITVRQLKSELRSSPFLSETLADARKQNKVTEQPKTAQSPTILRGQLWKIYFGDMEHGAKQSKPTGVFGCTVLADSAGMAIDKARAAFPEKEIIFVSGRDTTFGMPDADMLVF